MENGGAPTLLINTENNQLKKNPSIEFQTLDSNSNSLSNKTNTIEIVKKPSIVPAIKKQVFEIPNQIIAKNYSKNEVEIIAKCITIRALNFSFIISVSSPIALIALKIREYHDSTIENIVLYRDKVWRDNIIDYSNLKKRIIDIGIEGGFPIPTTQLIWYDFSSSFIEDSPILQFRSPNVNNNNIQRYP